jgi:hypothetical protein
MSFCALAVTENLLFRVKMVLLTVPEMYRLAAVDSGKIWFSDKHDLL